MPARPFFRLNPPNYQSLYETVGSHPGLHLQRLMLGYSYSAGIFRRNGEDLKAFFVQTEHPSQAETFFRSPDVTHSTHSDAVRLLHNYVAAAKTLVDHTRVLMSGSCIDSSHLQDYRGQVQKTFKDVPVVSFVHDLRNYLLHCSAPPLAFTSAILPDGEMEHQYDLELGTMRPWSGWSATGRRFIDSSPEMLPLRDVVGAYGERVDGFSSWFVARFRTQYEKLLREVETLQRNLNR
jgi:hypothetical protein